MTEKEFTPTFRNAYAKLLSRLTVRKTDCNTFGQALRLFKVPPTAPIGFPTIQHLRLNYSRGLTAVYIFRLHHPHKEGFTHGIHLRLNGFVHRRIFESFIEQTVAAFSGEMVDLKVVVPVIKKSVALYDYLQTLYVFPTNLLVNFSHHSDAIAEISKGIKINNKENTALKCKMSTLTQSIIDTMVAMPSQYPLSYLCSLLVMKNSDFRRHMRATNLDEMVMRVAQDSYNIALQDNRLKRNEVQELMEPMTRRSMLNRCINPRITKQVQLLLQQTFENQFVHPHPYNGIVRSDLAKLRALDGIIFDPRFLFSLLLVSRWFVRACMLEDFYTSNNHAHLLLYGGAGTGKTLIVSAISSSIATYRFVTGSRFQNPDLLKSSLLSLEEFDTASLPSNQYKQLLDLKSHMKIDFKNLNPENVTEGVPCMITTNDEVFTVLRQQKKINQASVDAALRRLYLVPVKAGAFEKLHGRVPKDSPLFKLLLEHDHKFDQEYNKLQRIFNLIVAFALYQQDVRGFYFDSRIHPYFQTLAKDFSRTTFGTFYLSNKDSIDAIVGEAEHSMGLSDQDDSSYLVKISTCVGQFQQLLYDFIGNMSVNNSEIDPIVLKDKTVPWPAKAYYYLGSYRFIVRVMHQVENCETYLNEEVRGFINNPNMQLYRATDAVLNNSDQSQYEPYKDLQDPLDTDQEEQDPFAFSPDPVPENTEMLPPLGVVRREISVLDLDQAEIQSVFSGISGKRSMSQRYGMDDDEFKIREEAYDDNKFEQQDDQYQGQQDIFQ